MAGRKTKLTGVVLDTVVGHIRAGAFGWVAAEAAGISQRTFYNWITRGERGEQPYVLFEAAVRQAKAQARLSAELRVHRQGPLAWLRYGPGRSQRAHPGWTELQDELQPDELLHGDPAEMDELSLALAEFDCDEPSFVAPPEPGHVCCGCNRPPAEEPPASTPEAVPCPATQSVVPAADSFAALTTTSGLPNMVSRRGHSGPAHPNGRHGRTHDDGPATRFHRDGPRRGGR